MLYYHLYCYGVATNHFNFYRDSNIPSSIWGAHSYCIIILHSPTAYATRSILFNSLPDFIFYAIRIKTVPTGSNHVETH